MSRLSQNKQVLKYLQSGRSLTQDQAKDLFGVRRLASRIYDLEKLEHSIEREMIRPATGGAFGSYAKYTLAS